MPLVLVTVMRCHSAPNTLRSACTSHCALPPRAGVNVSCDMKCKAPASAERRSPCRASIRATNFSSSSETCATSIRVGW